jgi:hypothetical protein
MSQILASKPKSGRSLSVSRGEKSEMGSSTHDISVLYESDVKKLQREVESYIRKLEVQRK